MKWRTLVVAVFSLASVNCANFSAEEKSPQSQFQSNYISWQDHKLSNYDFTLKQQCYCPVELTKKLRVSVRDGKVTELRYLKDNTPLPNHLVSEVYSIDGWFNVINKSFENQAHHIEVRYHKDMTYPTRISIDRRMNVADDEIDAVILDLEPK